MARLLQWVRYAAVSAVSTTTTFTALTALVATNALPAGAANVVATGLGTIPSFELNRRWVWRRNGRRGITREIVPFCVLSFAGLVLSTLAVSLAARWAGAHGVGGTERTAIVLGANVATFGSLWLVQFAVLDRLPFAPAR